MTEFAQEINENDDPFAGSDFDFPGEDAPADTTDLPVVDREGRPVEPQQAQASPAPAQTPPPGQPDAATDRPVESADVLEAEAAAASDPTTEDPTPVAPVAASPPTESTPTPSAAPVSTEGSSTSPAESAGPTDADMAAAALGSDEVLPATAEPESDATEADAPAPTPTSKKRSYLLFQPDGPGKYSQVFWYEDKAGKMVARGAPGAKRQGVALARGTEDALHTGYAAVGSPPPGCKLVAVAAANFQVRDVKPKPPEPGKQRLQIS